MITLYDYQEDAENKINVHFENNSTALMVMATGLGKTVTVSMWAQKFIGQHRGLFLCHDNTILEQAMKEFQKVNGHLNPSFGLFHGEEKTEEEVDILFGSFQTMRNWKRGFPRDYFHFIIVDESHRGQAKTYKEVIKYFKPRYLLGMTATPDREDELDIRNIFGPEVVDIPLETAIGNGWLTEVDYRIISDNLDEKALERLIKKAGESRERISLDDINREVFIEARDEEVARIILAENKKTVIFCRNVNHTENFRQFIPNSRTYHSKRSKKENRETFELFQENGLKYILVVDKINEGVDIPDAEVLAFLRNTESERIFKQQLGRGLRRHENKKKVIVLDFVANIERVLYVEEMARKIKARSRWDSASTEDPEINPNREKKETDDPIHITGKGFNFNFNQTQVDLLRFFEKTRGNNFYQTWKEASEAAIKLGFKNSNGYKKGYKQDSQLPNDPYAIYPDFPGWEKFLGKARSRSNFYPTWQEASEAAAKLGIKSFEDYRERYNQDSRLPSELYRFYSDFPGGDEFFRKTYSEIRFYPTWQEASEAAIKLKIKNFEEYRRRYKQDSRLPSTPPRSYADFPGWVMFLGGTAKEKKYLTLQEASEAAVNLGINTQEEYRKNYKKDSKLPCNPGIFYPNFIGWGKFLGKSRSRSNFYPTWQEASEAAIKLEITNKYEYKAKYKNDSRLVADPRKAYNDFPGWKKFLGKK